MAVVQFDGVEYRIDCFSTQCSPLSISASIHMSVVQDDERIPLARRRSDVRSGNPILLMAEYDPEIYAPGSTVLSVSEPKEVERLLRMGDVEKIQDGLLKLAQKRNVIPLQLIGFGRGNHEPKEVNKQDKVDNKAKESRDD